LIRYYRNRRAWLVDADAVPSTVTPYPPPADSSTYLAGR
jgi:hypothetical protein